jgi:hypothetical protein
VFYGRLVGRRRRVFHCLLNFIGKRIEMPVQSVEHVPLVFVGCRQVADKRGLYGILTQRPGNRSLRRLEPLNPPRTFPQFNGVAVNKLFGAYFCVFLSLAP